MTDILPVLEGAIAILVAVSPFIVSKYKDASYALSIVQNFLDLLSVAGITLVQITAGTVTDAQKIKLADAFIAFLVLIHFDKTVNAEIYETPADTAVTRVE
jgi:hypothetical protein